ncbi:Methyl farnesoate epoxidase [Orchesella cincta]|uniref:Methyl farnesoate epoxidase n=1 Tax=Orchesella cincta TaxID=48709 RepID=A0A1D2N0W9_ORCCI|nr:Methyl farnesoate epoxidase [Orchesella cincta]
MVFGLIEAFLVATASLFALIYFTKSKKESRYPPGPTPLPLLGNLHQIGRDPLKAFQQWAKQYGPIYTVRMGSNHTIVINDHKLLKELFSDNASTGRDNDNPVFNAFSKTSGIINAEGPTWVEQRRFTVSKLRDMGLLKRSIESLILTEVKSLLKVLERNAGKPLSENRMFNGAVVNTLWGIVSGERSEWDAEVEPEILKRAGELVPSINRVSSTGLIFAPFLRYIVPKWSGWTDWINKLSNFLELMDVTIANHTKNGGSDHPQNFIDYYLGQIGTEEDPASSFYKDTGGENLKAVLSDLFLAGSETSSTSLAWTMLHLSQDQVAQRRMQKELDKVLGEPGSRLPSCEDRPLLPFTEAVAMEVLRLDPVAPFGVPHKMRQDMEFHGHFLPKGATVWANIYGIHHDPNVWGDDVEEFKPERFLNDDGTKVIRRDAFIPFSIGRRACPGMPLALDTLFLFLSSIFHRFNVEPDPDCLMADFTPLVGIALKPKPFKVVFNTRTT